MGSNAPLPSAIADRRLMTLCHDLRQYVATGLLMSDLDGDSSLTQEVEARFAALHSLFHQIGLIIDAEVSDSTSPRSRIDLREVVGECVEVVRLRHQRVRASLAPAASAFGDAVLVRRAVANVLDNAVRAAGDEGSVEVRLRTEDGDSLIEVVDDGTGFGRGPRGTGQGLSVVAMAVETCRGRLEIISGPGPGTTVRMVLPRDGGRP
jgi:signal transduction histidine kinase